jgi:hypothetical protein
LFEEELCANAELLRRIMEIWTLLTLSQPSSPLSPTSSPMLTALVLKLLA